MTTKPAKQKKTDKSAPKAQIVTVGDLREAIFSKFNFCVRLPPAFEAMFFLGCVAGAADPQKKLSDTDLMVARAVAIYGRKRRKYAPKVLPIAERRMQTFVQEILDQLPPQKEQVCT